MTSFWIFNFFLAHHDASPNGLGFNIYEGGTDAADPAYTRYGCDRLLLECLTCGNPRTGW